MTNRDTQVGPPTWLKVKLETLLLGRIKGDSLAVDVALDALRTRDVTPPNESSIIQRRGMQPEGRGSFSLVPLVGCGRTWQPQENAVTAAPDPGEVHAHIPVPGYSNATGSAAMTIIYELSRWHVAAGGRTVVMVTKGARHDYPMGECIEVDGALRLPTRRETVVDAVRGPLGLTAPFADRSHVDLCEGVSATPTGCLPGTRQGRCDG